MPCLESQQVAGEVSCFPPLKEKVHIVCRNTVTDFPIFSCQQGLEAFEQKILRLYVSDEALEWFFEVRSTAYKGISSINSSHTE
ncbi:hypothetical protein ILYODFUR_030488 [Ilyodon furcidens]|uniref:Uncharacterized protein n=1 Tax=Ilyodon furcidens TaxID=33524 RepID=A0ABV0TCB7_9TELE